mgnify:CR=1 FL=1
MIYKPTERHLIFPNNHFTIHCQNSIRNLETNIEYLEKKLNELPAVDSANVYLNLNGKLNVDIKQRVPVFRLNNGGKGFYVDKKGIEFPISKTYSHPCMLVSGDVKKKEYKKLIELIEKINKDSFCKNFFVGITKENGNFNIATNDGNYKVEIGDLDRIDFKVKGFKTFVEKYLVYQASEKYSKISDCHKVVLISIFLL